ncbi:ABC transporter substrate-binding protein [Variovorax sp. V213]|uniref:ABC transporter substrate-binding protein n=1 Tax=Variovorax sp. V213 TaxID=3065955 RepID=UPI0034E884BF
MMKRAAAIATCCVIGLTAFTAQATTTLKVVMGADLKILDPIWATNYLTRNYGYMVYDTLLAQDANGNLKPQMLESYVESPDKLTYNFTLRSGLLWHDGTVVTADDCVASVKRWGAKDPIGQKVMSSVDTIKVEGEKTFSIKLKEPSSLLLRALGKSSPTVAFMMPKRVAETNSNTQINEFIGSGPFVFKKDEWRPGDKAVFVKFDKYKPRSEPASGLAGGKVVKVDRVEWLAISDSQQAVNALESGEIDYIATPPHDLLPLLNKNKEVKIVNLTPLGSYFVFKPNWLAKPFDNEKVRRALWYTFNQRDFLSAAIGNPQYYKICKSLYPCDTTFTSDKGLGNGFMESNFVKARELLKEGGYDGTPIVILQSTDLPNHTNLAPVAKSLMEKAGFKVSIETMDWQTLIARRTKKDAPSAGGWHGFFTSWASADVQDPVSQIFLSTTCDKALYGWPCDAQMETLRDRFSKETDPAKQKAIAEEIQVRNVQINAMMNVGQYYQPTAIRQNISGLVSAAAPVFWGIEKK